MIAEPLGEPSSLADVLRFVVDVFSALGNMTPIQVGSHYLTDFGVGDPPLILFVPEVDSKIGPPIECGNSHSETQGCVVRIRGAEDGSDLGRFDSADEIQRLVVDAIRRGATGRLELGKSGDDSPITADGYGADKMFSFTYQHDVRHGAAWSLSMGEPDDAPPFNTLAPNAIPAVTVAIYPTASPSE